MKQPINNNLIIELHVPDFELVKEFYTKIGFVVSVEDKPNDNSVGYLTMIRENELGKTLINFYGDSEKVYDQSFFKQFPHETTRGYAVSITIPVKNIADLYQSVQTSMKESIVRELKEIKENDVAWQDFRMVDPFGFYLRFTELIDWGQK